MTDVSPRPARRRRTVASVTIAPEEPMLTTLEPTAPTHDVHPDEPRPTGLAAIPALRPLSPVPTYIGIAVAAAGFVLLAVAWGGVAGEANVARQVPYLVSGGLFGIGLILVGLTIVNVAAKRRDAALRERQIQLLASAVRQLGGNEGQR